MLNKNLPEQKLNTAIIINFIFVLRFKQNIQRQGYPIYI